MENTKRYEIDNAGNMVEGEPNVLDSRQRCMLIEQMFSIGDWEYTELEEITSAHYHIRLRNKNLNVEQEFHLFHGNIRKEDPKRSRYEKKIQLGVNNDPRKYPNSLILGFYVYEEPFVLENTLIAAWPVEDDKHYDQNPSLRVNVENDLLPAKINGYHVDDVTGKNVIAFKPEYIYHYLNSIRPLLSKD